MSDSFFLTALCNCFYRGKRAGLRPQRNQARGGCAGFASQLAKCHGPPWLPMGAHFVIITEMPTHWRFISNSTCGADVDEEIFYTF